MFEDELNDDFAANSKITMFVNGGVFVENVKNVVSVLDSEIVVRLAQKNIVKIVGKSLQIADIQAKTCKIKGEIISVSFEGKNDKK